MFTVRPCIVALKRCDAAGENELTPVQKSAPYIGHEDCRILPATTVGVKYELDINETKSTNAIIGETSDIADVSFKPAGNYCGEKVTKSVNSAQEKGLFLSFEATDFKQFDLLQTCQFVKTEKEEELISSELLGGSVVEDPLNTPADNQNQVEEQNAVDLRGDTSIPFNVSSEREHFHFSQTNKSIKVEGDKEGEGLMTSAFEGCAIADNPIRTDDDDCAEMGATNLNDEQGSVSISANSPTCEDSSCLQAGLRIKTEKVEKVEGSKTSEVGHTVTDDLLNIATDEKTLKNNIKDLQGNTSGDSCTDLEQLSFSPSDVHIKKEEVEEDLITKDLVGCLPGSLDDFKGDSKALLNVMQFEVSGGNNFYHVSLTNDKDVFKDDKRTSKQLSITPKDDCFFQCSCCSATFKEKSKSSENSLKNFDSKPYVCSWCQMKFEQNGKLDLTMHLTDRYFECAHCNAHFRSKRLLSCHVSKHFTGVTFSCRLPPTSHQAHLKPRPYTRSHEYSCEHCSAKFKTKRLIMTHVITHREKSLSCSHCLLVFKRRHELNSHVKRHTKEQSYLCHQCPKEFAHYSGLMSHLIRVHSGEKRFLCHQCPARFSLRAKLTRHLLVHSDERKYACMQCPAKFKCSYTFKRHSQIHLPPGAIKAQSRRVTAQSDERPYSCPHCSWRFKWADRLSQHVRIVHSGAEKKYRCDLCSYRTHNPTDLTKHSVVHTGEKAFGCDKCPRKFTRMTSLKRHAPQHSNERPFVCTYCPKTFKSKRLLHSHTKVHSNKNRHACPECPSTFQSLHRLKAHSKLHSGGKIFACAHCPAIFPGRRNLIQHLMVHSENRCFECAHCLLRFKMKRNLQSHITKFHKENGPQQTSFSM